MFVRLAGLQFDRINLEQYATAADMAFACLNRSLADTATRQQLQQAQVGGLPMQPFLPLSCPLGR